MCDSHDRFAKVETLARQLNDEHWLDTILFFRNYREIFRRFDDWKDIDRFYFIPLYLEMTYSLGWVAEIAPDPVWLGSFVRCNLEHPDLFQVQCPQCKQLVYPFRYAGSPLSGRVDLEYECSCGQKGFETVSGWRLRANALRDQIAADTPRFRKYKKHHRDTVLATVVDLLEFM